LVVLTAPDDQRWPFSCANHALASQITKSGWSTKQAERKIGQLTMENEILRAVAEKADPADRPAWQQTADLLRQRPFVGVPT
jgi:hypothetical protein